jgi:hypothetical protein
MEIAVKSSGGASPGFAVHAFSGVIERALREFIFRSLYGDQNFGSNWRTVSIRQSSQTE